MQRSVWRQPCCHDARPVPGDISPDLLFCTVVSNGLWQIPCPRAALLTQHPNFEYMCVSGEVNVVLLEKSHRFNLPGGETLKHLIDNFRRHDMCDELRRALATRSIPGSAKDPTDRLRVVDALLQKLSASKPREIVIVCYTWEELEVYVSTIIELCKGPNSRVTTLTTGCEPTSSSRGIRTPAHYLSGSIVMATDNTRTPDKVRISNGEVCIPALLR